MNQKSVRARSPSTRSRKRTIKAVVVLLLALSVNAIQGSSCSCSVHNRLAPLDSRHCTVVLQHVRQDLRHALSQQSCQSCAHPVCCRDNDYCKLYYNLTGKHGNSLKYKKSLKYTPSHVYSKLSILCTVCHCSCHVSLDNAYTILPILSLFTAKS